MKYLLLGILMVMGSCNKGAQNQKNTPQPIKATGVKQYSWIDASRTDPHYAGQRIINAQVWYPSEKTDRDSIPAPYYFSIEKAHPKLENWSEEDFNQVNLVVTKSVMESPLLNHSKKYPLLVFSPSLGGNLSMYTYYAERLAAEGYIVMGINHLYESEYVLDLQEKVILANLSFHDSLKTLQIPEEITAERYREVKGERQKILGLDLIFGLNQLLEEPFFKDYIDKTQIGMYGHSFGGAAAIYASMLDERVKAVIDLDGTPPSVALEQGIDAHFLFIEDLTDYNNHIGYGKLHKRRNDFCELNRSDSWRVLIGGFNHNSFLDINYYLAENETNRLQEERNLNLILKYMNSFLNTYLLKSKQDSLKPQLTDSLQIFEFRSQ